ncbi:MAG: tol-pal system protein YbgF [Gammaproteobacteria bacterium]|nr:tol-pal system protein YbgF [Gammaproteobacteria bacterium]
MKLSVIRILLVGLAVCPLSGVWAEDLPPVIDTPGVGSVAAPPSNRTNVKVAVPEKQDVESRLSRLERVLSGGTLMNMAVKLDAMQEDVRHMQGAGEELGHEIETLKRRQRDLYMDIDRRLSDIENALKNLQKGGAAPGTTGDSGQQPAGTAEAGQVGAPSGGPAAGVIIATPAPTTPAPSSAAPQVAEPAAPAATETQGAAPATPAASPLQEQSDYEAALAVLRGGDYENAQQAFAKFVETYPQGAFADNAYYWQGEANYVMRRYEDAIVSFNKVIAMFPDSAKVPAAMLKTGFSYYGLKQWDKARDILEKVKTQYPQGSVAQLAEKRLHRMKIEGH